MSDSNSLEAKVKSISFQSDKTRRQILVSYWLVVLLAIPLWWTTTSITRLSLPKTRVDQLDTSKLRFNIPLELDDTIPGRVAQEVEKGLRLELIDKNLEGLLDFSVNTFSHEGNAFTVSYDAQATDTRLEDRKLIIGGGSVGPEQLTGFATNTLSSILIANLGQADQHTLQYSPRYRLAFSLMCEDASTSGCPLGWDVEAALSRDIHPILRKLHALHNFTIESQVQYFAPLAFEPRKLDTDQYGLTQEQLSVFINSEEWTLASSVSNDPVLHFIIFVPSSHRRPLRILDNQDRITESTAFSIPQWGSIFIYNPPSSPSAGEKQQHLDASALSPIFAVFQRQLLALLGVAPIPTGTRPESYGTDILYEWQIDALMRRRAHENAVTTKGTLKSIVNLVDQIEGMPVDKDVTEDVNDALRYFEAMLSTAPASAAQALQYSATALTRASRAFFNPGMLALLYFPPEHNVAVYTPLLAPVTVPLVAAVIREVSKWRKERKGLGKAVVA